MPRYGGRNASLRILDSTSASRWLSTRASTATLNLDSEEVDVTCFGALNHERIADALRDWTIDVSGFWDDSASNLDEILYGIWAACTSVCFGPSGSTSGMVQYSGCMILQNFTIDVSVDGAVEYSAAFQAASTVNHGTWD